MINGLSRIHPLLHLNSFIFILWEESSTTCGGSILSSNPIDFNATWKCDKCGDVRRWNDDDLAGIENSLSSRLDDNEKDIKVIK